MTFDEYWATVDHYRYCEYCAKDAWNAAQQAELERLQPVIEALQECSDAMNYMSEYDIPLTLPDRVKAALESAGYVEEEE